MRIIQAPRTWLSHFSPSHLLHTMLLCATLLCSTLSCKTVIALPAQADTAQVDFAAMLAATHEHVLENGLKVIVREDHRSPIVSFQIWYHVGASDEPHHLTGISHVLEHLMFKGTTALQPGEFSAWISELGGQENAFTARDQTVYYQTWGAHNLALSMALEADRMSHLLFSQEEFDKELQVVKEERRLRTEDNPNAKLYERFLRVAYQSSPYGQPVIGWMHDLDHITLKDAQNWYKSWYAPNNATIIIAGDVHAADVFSEAQRAFGNTPRHTLPKRNRPLEVEPLGEKRLIVKAPAQLPTLLMGFVAPSLTTADNPADAHALYMLSAILDGGESARLASHVVRGNEIAASASASYSPISRGDTLFLLSGTPNKTIGIGQLETALWAEIKALQANPPTQQELDRVRAQLIAGLIYDQDSLSGQSHGIGQLESAGMSWRDFPELVNALSAVTPKAVQAAAQKYLIADHLTVGQLDPQPMDAPPLSSSRASIDDATRQH